MHGFLARLGLYFPSPEEERLFADQYLRRVTRQTQIVLLIGAVFIVAFAFLDWLLDPVKWKSGLYIRGFLIAPFDCLCAALLATRLGQRYFEGVFLLAVFATQAGLAWVCAVLDAGYAYASLAFTLALLGAMAIPVRAIWMVVAAIGTLIIAILGNLIANQAPGNSLAITIISVVCAGTFVSLSASMREQSARGEFLAQNALAQSRRQVDDLLYSMLPAEIVGRIQSGETLIADTHEDVSIVFADLNGFTALSRQIDPSHLIDILNEVFSAMDVEADKYAMDRIKTIGDNYMAVGGIGAHGCGDAARDAVDFALAIRRTAHGIVERFGLPLDLRVGIHAGPVVAGVIGLKRPAFDCWGDTVNLASRIESNGKPGAIIVSEAVYDRLRHRYSFEPLGERDYRGIGPARVFELLGPSVRAEAIGGQSRIAA